MSSIIKTRTQGFRVCSFRNQDVHKYYSHLQSVMRSIEPSGKYNELFAKPEVDTMAVGATEIEWTCQGNDRAIHISQVSESEQQNAKNFISEAFSKIEAYIAENKDKSGKNRDYAQFLGIIGKRPDTNQIWIVNHKPIVVQWGFVDENGLMCSSGIYSDWDSFINDIHKVEQEKQVEDTKKEVVVETIASTASPALFAEKEKVEEVAEKVETKVVEEKAKEPENKPDEPKKEEKKPVNTEEKKKVMAGLGGYEWVKWLAILLAIIIIILLLLRTLVPPQNNLGLGGLGLGGLNGGSLGGMNGGGAGGSGSGGAGGPGDEMGGSPGNDGMNQKGGKGNSGSTSVCPVCNKQFGQHQPEDYQGCILRASKGGETNTLQNDLKKAEEGIKKHDEALKELEAENEPKVDTSKAEEKTGDR